MEYGQINKIEEDIKSLEEEIKLYDMLIQKEPKWGEILSSIDKNIPYKVQLNNLSLSYLDENNKENQNDDGGNAHQEMFVIVIAVREKVWNRNRAVVLGINSQPFCNE